MSAQRMTTETRPRILLVEDELAVREMLARALCRQGYDLLLASNGSEAVALRDDEIKDVDLLISDLIMPGANGAEVASSLRQRVPNLNVLFMSGSGDHPVLHRVLTGGERFIGKPFSIAQFSNVVLQALAAQPES